MSVDLAQTSALSRPEKGAVEKQLESGAALLGMRRILSNPAFLLVLILGVLGVRCFDALRYPELAWEDGNQMLGFFFNSPEPSSILRFYNGYALLLPNAVAWLATRGPVTLAPQWFTLASMLIAASGIFLLSRPQSAWLIPNAVDRIIVALLLVLLPLGKSYVVYNLAYALWSILFLLVVLVSQPLPDSRVRLALRSLLILVCIFSHPLSLIVLPICGIQLILEKRWPQRACMALFGAAIIGFQLFGVERSAPVQLTFDAAILSVRLFLSRVVFESVFGALASTTLIPENAQLVHYFAVIILLVMAAITWTSRWPWRVKLAAGIAVMLAFGVVFASSVARLANGPDTPHVFKFYLQRYFYVPKLVLMTFLLAQIVPRFRSALTSWSWPVKGMALLACAVYLLAVNRANNRLYHNAHEEGVRIAEFLEKVDANVRLARAGMPYSSEWTLPRDPGWEIHLSVDQHLGKTAPAPVIREGINSGSPVPVGSVNAGEAVKSP